LTRSILKMSGEAIVDVEGEAVISAERLDAFSKQVDEGLRARPGLELGIVVGGGNILRGKSLRGVSRTRADYMGMLATVINALALKDSLKRFDRDSRVMSGIEMSKVAEPYIYERAIRHFEKGRIVIFAGGTGNPHFTTDTAAALRATEMEADVLLLSKFGTDGVYDKDPRKFADAVKYQTIHYDEFLAGNLKVMDATAVSLCREHDLPIYVFDTETDSGVLDAILGKIDAGTYISSRR
jgi:uridylate kinase